MLKWKEVETILSLNQKRLFRINTYYKVFRRFSNQNDIYCSDSDDEVVAICNNPKARKKNKKMSHKEMLNTYFESNQMRLKVKDLLPEECFSLKKNADFLYLIDPLNAKKVTSCILPYLKQDTSKIIAECTPGLGLISKDLLKNGIEAIRLYEPIPKFRDHLKHLHTLYPGKVQLFTKSLFNLSSYFYIDKMDNGNRVDQLLRGIPKISWNNAPVLTIIGSTTNTQFLRHLAKALPMQTGLVAYGRFEMFLMMKPRDYVVLTADVPLDFLSFGYMTILFNLFFDYEIIEKLPRRAFLPWESETKYMAKHKVRKIDPDKMYLVRAVWKSDLPLPVEQLMFFYHFAKQFYGSRTKVVPTLETWVPGCGEHVICPKLQHDDYYEDMGIHTEFGDLNPNQILGVFKEMYHHPSFGGSPFLGMVEAELIKSETIESKSNVISSDLEKNIVNDIEVNLNET
ncbi:hypothetical protein WA026_015807 [Henosepilachna vigintioctopunctata]|uniref:Dimethyladenosine transferase 2, mitochondrial n=1 Tax=Henosepilachna vigintioctopunctata TaxID=420089 RepID=A0AAW1V0N4_9CUCU